MALAVALVLLVVGTIVFAATLAPDLFVWAKFVTVAKEAMEVEGVGQRWTGSFRFSGRDDVATVANPFCSSSLIALEILFDRPEPLRWP